MTLTLTLTLTARRSWTAPSRSPLPRPANCENLHHRQQQDSSSTSRTSSCFQSTSVSLFNSHKGPNSWYKRSHWVNAVRAKNHSVDAPARHDDILVKSTHPTLSRRSVRKTQGALKPIPVSGYKRQTTKFTSHCTHTIKTNQVLIQFRLTCFAVFVFGLCLQRRIQRAHCAQRRIWIGANFGLKSKS